MNKIIFISNLFLFIPLLSISQQAFGSNITVSGTTVKSHPNKMVSTNAKATDYLGNADLSERLDLGEEADRKVEAFYRYLGYLVDTNIDGKTKIEVAMMASDLFIESATICDSLLLANEQQTTYYDVEEFLKRMLEFNKTNISIKHSSFSDKLVFDPSTTTKNYDIIESVTFTLLSDKTINNTSKTIVVHFIFLENSNKVKFIIKLGNISFSK